MRARRVLAKTALTLLLTLVFLGSSLLPRFTPSAQAADTGAPPLPVPEDPMGQQPEQQTPEISLTIDVRDGHPSARVVDIWGPGRTPFIVRAFTNATASLPGGWHFNQLLDDLGPGTLDADGNRVVYTYSSTRWNADQSEKWDVYVHDIGTVSTKELHYTCTPGVPEGPTPQPSPSGQTARLPQPRPTVARRTAGTTIPPDCAWDGTAVIYLPKGVTRKFVQGVITEERDLNGNVTTFTQTAFADQIRKYVATVRDPVGRVTTYTYEHASQECVQWGPDGMTCLQYKWHYRVRSITDPWGRMATYTYDGGGRIASVVNGAGRTTSYTYATGLGITTARGFPTTVQFGFSPPDYTTFRVLRVTAPDGTYTSYAYTVNFLTKRVTRTVVTNARGYATTYDFYTGEDANYFGNVEKVTDPLGNITQYTYDTKHNVTQVTDARGNRTTYAYSSRNKVTQIVKAAGSLNLTTTATWDSSDNLLSVVNPKGVRTDYTYDAKNNLTQACKAPNTVNACAQFAYNSWGGITSITNPRGYVTGYTYTARHQVLTITPPAGTNGPTTFGYNSFDDQITRRDGNNHTWTTTYDASRLVTSVTDPLNNVVSYQYDANGNRTRITDAKGQPTNFAYDNRDRLTRITDPLNKVTSYTYDAASNLTQITNAKNVIATTFTYDAANRLTQVKDALQQPTTYQYDQVGNRTQMTDRKNQSATYTYDQANRLTQVSAGGQTITYTYDTNGNRLTMVDPTGTTGYAYDNLDRLTQTTYPDTKTVQAAYDKAGNRTSLTNPGAISTTAQYDGANRLTQMTQGTLTWTFGYDSAGNRTSLTHPNGTSIVYAYLNNNWLSSVTHRAPGGSTLQSFSYTYDANGNRLTQADSSGTTGFTYDALNRLTQAVYPGAYGTYSWLYDAVGNRTQQTGPGGTINYGYDGNNRLLTAGSTSYGYDNNGNLLTISTGRTLTWDVFNRLTSTTAGGSTVTYTYNGDGLKTRRVGPNGTTNYYYDGIRPIWETTSTGAMTAQYDRDIFGNLLSRKDSSNARWYFHHDGIGSTTALTDASGALAATLLYDAWGNQRAATGSGQGNYRFAGTELDTTTGLYHMGARFYDPTIGRWLSEDPVQDKPFEPATLNYYAYANDNPPVLVDPDGRAAALGVLALRVAVPGFGEVSLVGFGAFALGVAVYAGAGAYLDMREAKHQKEVALGQLETMLEHAKNVNSPNSPKDPKGKWTRELLDKLNIVKEKVQKLGKSYEQIIKELLTKNPKRLDEALKQLEQLISELKKMGIDSGQYFNP